MMSPDHQFSFVLQSIAAILFAVGLLIVVFRRNFIIIIMGLELMLNAAALSLVGFSHHFSQIEGQVQMFFIITLAAAESAIGLSLLVHWYRQSGSLETTDAQLLKG
jgi:NADH-quinone oxidoreductase subunit K